MSSADRSHYAEAVTRLSEGELRDVVGVAEPPFCLLGGWAVHLHVTDAFRDRHGRAYVGSRDASDGLYERAARLVGVDAALVRQSIEQLFV